MIKTVLAVIGGCTVTAVFLLFVLALICANDPSIRKDNESDI